ncbi:hypothetical protein STEG23_026345, partial [Scotinomys teguina]
MVSVPDKQLRHTETAECSRLNRQPETLQELLRLTASQAPSSRTAMQQDSIQRIPGTRFAEHLDRHQCRESSSNRYNPRVMEKTQDIVFQCKSVRILPEDSHEQKDKDLMYPLPQVIFVSQRRLDQPQDSHV